MISKTPLLTALIGLFVLHSHAQEPDYERQVLDAVAANFRALHSGHIVWSRHTKDKGFLDPAREFEQSGQYEMWWDGEKLATKSLESETGGMMGGQLTSYDGSEWRAIPANEEFNDIAIKQRPEYRTFENWFLETGGRKTEDEFRMLRELAENGRVALTWMSVPTEDRGPAIQLVAENMETRASSRFQFLADNGLQLGRIEFVDPSGRVYMRKDFRYHEVVPGAWFPVSVHARSWSDTNEIWLEHLMEVDLSASTFNDTNDIPPGVFRLEIKPGAEVSDYRLGFRLNFDTGALALNKDSLKAVFDQFVGSETATAAGSQRDPESVDLDLPGGQRNSGSEWILRRTILAAIGVGLILIGANAIRSRLKSRRP